MKHKYFTFLTAVLAVTALAGTAQSQVVEQFGYTAGDLVANSGGTWTAHSGAGTNNEQVVATSLAYPGMTNVTGGAVTFANTGQDVARSGFSITTASLTTAYFSAVVSLSAATATGDYFMHFIDGIQTSGAFRGRLFAKTSGAGFVLGLQYGTTATSGVPSLIYDTTVIPFNTPTFVVVKLTSVPGINNDSGSLFINKPFGGSEPSPTLTSPQVDPNQDWGNLDFVAIRQGGSTSGAAGSVDTIRVGSTWAQVSAADASASGVEGWKLY